MTGKIVTIKHCPDYDEQRLTATLEEIYRLHSGLGRFIARGDRVLIKPNLIAAVHRETAAVTDPALILALARLLKDFGARPFIGDAPAWNNTSACMNILGLAEPLRKLGVPWQQMNQPRRITIDGIKVGISAHALDADKIINLPKLKAHSQVGATIAVKNLYGCVAGKEKALWHFLRGKEYERFCSLLLGICHHLAPALNIIDAVLAMEGRGPLKGRPKKTGLILAGPDPLACERVCCRIFNWPEDSLLILKTARRRHLNYPAFDAIDIRGDDITRLKIPSLALPDLIPLRFSLKQICRSLVVQAGLLTRSFFTPRDHSPTHEP